MNYANISIDHSDLYLDAIYHLQQQQSPVDTATLAERLRITLPSVSQMIHKLMGQGLVHYEPRRGVTLTAAGERRALLLVRRHRLWEVFLADYLHLDWQQVYEEACRLEHVTTPLVAARLEEFLGHPDTCPHGNPVPNAAGEIAELDTVPLVEVEAGETRRVRTILERDADILNYLTTIGVKPESNITVLERAPFEGPITIQVGEQVKPLSYTLAQHILVEHGAE